jgi:hypothetical protein
VLVDKGPTGVEVDVCVLVGDSSALCGVARLQKSRNCWNCGCTYVFSDPFAPLFEAQVSQADSSSWKGVPAEQRRLFTFPTFCPSIKQLLQGAKHSAGTMLSSRLSRFRGLTFTAADVA